MTFNPANDHESRLVICSGRNLNPIRIVPQRLSSREINAMLPPVALALVVVELELHWYIIYTIIDEMSIVFWMRTRLSNNSCRFSHVVLGLKQLGRQ